MKGEPVGGQPFPDPRSPFAVLAPWSVERIQLPFGSASLEVCGVCPRRGARPCLVRPGGAGRGSAALERHGHVESRSAATLIRALAVSKKSDGWTSTSYSPARRPRGPRPARPEPLGDAPYARPSASPARVTVNSTCSGTAGPLGLHPHPDISPALEDDLAGRCPTPLGNVDRLAPKLSRSPEPRSPRARGRRAALRYATASPRARSSGAP